MNIRHLVCISTLTPLLSLAACTSEPGDDSDSNAGTETGDGDGDGDNEGLSGSCGEQTETVLDDLFTTPPGFDMALNELLANFEGNFEGTFTWFDADGPWYPVHAGSESPLVAAMAYSGGAIRLVEVEDAGQPPSGEGLEGEGLCANYVVIDVILEFATDDGVFAESLVVPLTIAGTDGGDEPSFYYSLDLGALMGTLDEADFIVDDGTLTDVIMSGNFNEASLYGSLGMEVQVGEGPEGIVGFGIIAGFDAPRVQ